MLKKILFFFYDHSQGVTMVFEFFLALVIKRVEIFYFAYMLVC